METDTAVKCDSSIMEGVAATANGGDETVTVSKSVIESYENRISELLTKQKSMVEMTLQYMPIIDGPPVPKTSLYSQACSGDTVTIDSWSKTWVDYTVKNAERFSYADCNVMSEYGKCAYRPAIIAGSGPSLKRNYEELRDNRNGITLVSCLHNFGFFEDNGIAADYYLNLDAGEITIPEVTQGGKKDVEHYWELTKDRTLVTATVGNPDLVKRWKGRVLFFSTVIPNEGVDAQLRQAMGGAYLPYFNIGGNTLGACLYMAKAILGACPIAFVGADFSFDYTRKFHPFDSPYDQKFAGVMPATDVYGNRVYTWPSYWNFKNWFDYIACGGSGNNPGIYVNCTQGGILGAYPEGNIRQIQPMDLRDFLYSFNMYKELPGLMKKFDPKPCLLF